MTYLQRVVPFILILSSAGLLAACGSSDSSEAPTDPIADTQAPVVTLDLAAHTAVSKSLTLPISWSDDVAVTRVDLIVDGVVSGSVNVLSGVLLTDQLEPGLHDIALEAADAAGHTTRTTAVNVVLEGRGTFLPSTDWQPGAVPGWVSSEVVVPSDGSAPEHPKTHAEIPAGFSQVQSLFHWTADASWKLGLDVGTGECPDSGAQLATIDVEGPMAVASIEHGEAGTALQAGLWFGHVRVLDPEAHADKSLTLHVLFLAIP